MRVRIHERPVSSGHSQNKMAALSGFLPDVRVAAKKKQAETLCVLKSYSSNNEHGR